MCCGRGGVSLAGAFYALLHASHCNGSCVGGGLNAFTKWAIRWVFELKVARDGFVCVRKGRGVRGGMGAFTKRASVWLRERKLARGGLVCMLERGLKWG